MLIFCGDVLQKPKNKLQYNFLNLLAAHKFGQVRVPSGFNATDKFDFTHLLLSHLQCTISLDNKILCLDSYKLI